MLVRFTVNGGIEKSPWLPLAIVNKHPAKKQVWYTSMSCIPLFTGICVGAWCAWLASWLVSMVPARVLSLNCGFEYRKGLYEPRATGDLRAVDTAKEKRADFSERQIAYSASLCICSSKSLQKQSVQGRWSGGLCQQRKRCLYLRL